MSELLRFVLIGLGVGALYALTAQGLVLVYRGSGVVNLAQGAFGMVGAFLFYEVRDVKGWATPVAWLVGVGVPVLLATATHLLLMKRLRRASPLVRLVSTLGLFFLLLAVAQRVWGTNTRPVTSPLPSTVRFPFGEDVPISEDRLWLLAIGIAVTAVLWLVFSRTRFGHATQAVAENVTAASALGLSPDAVASANWALGGALAAVTGILIAPILFLSAAALAFTVLRGLAAALVGRFRNVWLTLAGALAIGVVESVLGRFIEHDGVFRPLTDEQGQLFGVLSAQAVSRSSAFLIIVVLLVVSGRALPLRSEVLDRLPALGTGRVRWPVLVPAVALTAFVCMTAGAAWATAITLSLATAIVCLSLVVVTGFVGQLSLAQLSLAGFGAWVAARLADAGGVPFPLALAAGVLVTIPVGLAVALPALRTRGINLAVLTFGLSVVIVELVLRNSEVTGRLEGTQVGSPSLFGLDIDAFAHPDRYALVCLGALVVCSLAVANLRRGVTGRRFVAVRDNERAAASLGISVYGVKLFAFALGAAIAALGGVLLAFRQDTVNYQAFDAFGSIHVVVISVIGGIGYVLGPVAASLLAAGGVGAELLGHVSDDSELLNLVSGALLILTLVMNPNGLAHGWAGAGAALDRWIAARRSRPGRGPSVELPPPVPSTSERRRASLVVDELTVRFGAFTAVHDLSLRVDPGEVVGLIGPNGAGKTTIIDAVTGFVTPSAGRVRLGDEDVARWPAHRRVVAGLGRSFQSLELFEDLTVAENILAACDTRARWTSLRELVRPRPARLAPAAVAAIREFELEDDLDKRPGELPYGRRRLVAIARAMATGPDILLLDEPAAGLGDVERAELGRLVRRVADEWRLGILLVEHDVALVMRTCDRVVAIDFGEKVAEGTPDEVAADARVIASYLGEPEPATAEPAVSR